MGYDAIVVGAGSAGCVLAARLSAGERCGVLLVEAGPDYPVVGALPADIADESMPAMSHDWGLVSEPDKFGHSVPLPRGRLVGGCSAVNACFALRGWPADFDEWAARGNPGWSFDDLLPVFRAIESDADFGGGDWHGSGGPVPVRRPSAGELSPLQRAFADAAITAGHPAVTDHNRPGATGVGPAPRNVRGHLRMSTALTHLAAARGQPNLVIRADTVVDRVELRGTSVRGIRIAGGEIVDSDAVVLAAGSYASPAILMRSGIGPAAGLRELGIQVAVNLPGVGDNLTDHPLAAVDLPTTPGYAGPRFQVMLTMRSTLAGPGAPDLHLFPAGPFDDPSSAAGGVFGIVTALLSVRSRGSVRLRTANPADPPHIDIAHLRHPKDMARMIEATLHARRLSRTPPLAQLVTGTELAPGPAISDDDTAGLARSIRGRAGSYHHPVGTCAMGPDPGHGAVVSARGAVHGIAGLWVADASVMPTIPAANTNLSTIVIAERIAQWLATP